MLRIVLLCIVLLASVWIGVQLKQDPGYLLISVNQWTIETTLWVAIPGLMLTFFILHVFLLLTDKLIHLPAAWRKWRAIKRMQTAQAKTRQGLIEFSEGHWLSAKNHLINALPNTDTPLLNYLTAARAAQELGDSELRDDYLREASQSMPEAKIAVELTQAQLQLAHQQWEQALATLKHLQDLAPKHPYVLKLLSHLYEEINDWTQLITLLPILKRQRVLPKDAWEHLQQRTYFHALLELIKHPKEPDLAAFMQNLPKNVSNDPAITAEYCRYLLSIGDDVQAETRLRHFLQQNMSDAVIGLYGQIETSAPQLKFAESLLKKHPNYAPLYLCLGRICVSQQLWGKARTYFEAGIQHDATPALYAELGHLLEKLGDHNGACIAYRQGLSGLN